MSSDGRESAKGQGYWGLGGDGGWKMGMSASEYDGQTGCDRWERDRMERGGNATNDTRKTKQKGKKRKLRHFSVRFVSQAFVSFRFVLYPSK